MIESFDRAFEILMQFEGYRSDHPKDPGRLTICGISSRWYPEQVQAMRAMTEPEARAYAAEFYQATFWEPLGCDTLAHPLDVVVFDTAVNCGQATAKKLLNETRDWRDYLYKRLYYYTAICREKPALKEFLAGWVNRVLTLWFKFREAA